MRISDWSSDVCSSDLKEESQRFKQLCKLLRHRLVHAAVEIETYIHPFRLPRLHPLNHIDQQQGCAQPVQSPRRIQLAGSQTLFPPPQGGLADFVTPASPYSGLPADSTQPLPPQHFPRRKSP